MSIRLPIQLQTDIEEASLAYGICKNDIGNRSMRKWNKLKMNVSVAKIEQNEKDTKPFGNPTTIRFDPKLVEGKSDMLKRYILQWYMNDQKPNNKPTKPNIKEDQESIIKLNRNVTKLQQAILNY